MTWLAIGLALLNACCFTAGTWLQHSVSGDAPSLMAAARRPRWLAGLVLLATGAMFQVIALRLAPVTVVEPAGVIGIVVGVPLGLRARGDRLRRSTGWALAAILVGTVAFAVLAALNTVPAPITTGALLTVGAAVSAVVAGGRLATRLLNGRARFLVLGVGGGAAYGCTSTLVRAATERYAAHGAGVELLGILIGLAAAVLAGFWLVQRAHADGPPEGTVANLTVTDPLVAVSIGIGVLGEAPGLTWPTAGLGLVFAALAIGGVVRLSRDIPTGPDSPKSLLPAAPFTTGAPHARRPHPAHRHRRGHLSSRRQRHGELRTPPGRRARRARSRRPRHLPRRPGRRIRARHARAQSPARRADDGPRVPFVGRLDAEKNVDVLLRALPLLPERLRVTAEIVGDGSRRGELEDLARALGVADSVVFHGLVDDQEVLDAHARCDVFCMPGTAELQSLATMEAMAAGKPVVAADAMALPHLVRPGVNGLLFPPGDVPAPAAALGSVLGDPVTRTRMGGAGRETVTRHDIADTLDTFETLHQEVAGTPRHFRIARDGDRHEHPAHSGR